jgi:malate synthase
MGERDKSRSLQAGIEMISNLGPRFDSVLTPEAISFVGTLERTFDSQRRSLLDRRRDRQLVLDSGGIPDFLPETEPVRRGNWRVGSIPEDLQDRRVEITGPTDRKMMINALNSGAKIFMADFEDANSPTWNNMIQGQINLIDTVNRTISLTTEDGKHYRLNDRIATLLVRPRGWHLEERHLKVDGRPVSASLLDFGLYFFHNAKKLLQQRSGPYFYLPKMESHLEARLWNEVFNLAQDLLRIPRGTIKATVLIETILAAFEMEEILYELRDHVVALNAGRWDYIFSAIKKFRNRSDLVFPDRVQISMTVPFMRAYTELLIQTCHRRGAHAIGGMAAFIPSRKDPKVNETALRKVREDKEREAGDGCDGTWVAHPDLVPVALEIFDHVLGDRPHQKTRLRNEVRISAANLANFEVPGGEITEDGVRNNISVGILYLESWLRGIGAVAIYDLMEDTATAEISRSQLWQWVHSDRARLSDGRPISLDLLETWTSQELKKIRDTLGETAYRSGKFEKAREIFHRLVSDPVFIDFLPLVAYDELS